MKTFKYIFVFFSILAAVAIAVGAYWHIYTLAACGFLAYALHQDEKADSKK